MFKQPLFIRNFQAESYLELFLVSGVTSVLGLRFYLLLTNYPKIMIGHAHVAHLLWGGLLMTIAILLLLIFLNRQAMLLASMIGGFGFGAFVDELGKYITSDNNYFYQPTIALIYALFVIIYLTSQYLERLKSTSEDEYLINIIEVIKESIINDLDRHNRARALSYLKHLEANNPFKPILNHLLTEIDYVTVTKTNILTKFRSTVSRIYKYIISQPWFYYTIIFFFLIKSVVSIYNLNQIIDSPTDLLIVTTLSLMAVIGIYQIRFSGISARKVLLFGSILAAALLITIRLFPSELAFNLSFIGWGQIVSSVLSALVAFAGVITLRRSRLEAYHLFKYSGLISIFLTQFFAFYQNQLFGLITLVGNLVVIWTLRYMIDQEMIQERR